MHSGCVSSGHRAGTPPYLLPAGQQPQGKQGERTGSIKHLHVTEMLKVTDALVPLLRA